MITTALIWGLKSYPAWTQRHHFQQLLYLPLLGANLVELHGSPPSLPWICQEHEQGSQELKSGFNNLVSTSEFLNAQAL